MADDKDAKAVKANLAKLGPQMKESKAQIKELGKLNDEGLKLLDKLQSLAKSAKPPLAKNATLADLQKASGKLQELSRLAALRDRYAKSCDMTAKALSNRSQQRVMLNNLVKFSQTSLEQHTGGGSGGQGGGGRSSRAILQALTALKKGDKALDAAAKQAEGLNNGPPALSEKTPIKALDDHLKAMKNDQKRIEAIQSATDDVFGTVEQSGDAIADAMSDASA